MSTADRYKNTDAIPVKELVGSKCTLRDFMGDYALDIEPFDGHKITLYFNSRRNAETVKRCIEVDDSVPNAATVVDFVEVVRCKDCKHYNATYKDCAFYDFADNALTDFCSHGERSGKV
ncbi:MAG: hypothetical protein IJX39_08840 [Clostridia bacterium]|nr:hypothetical protein [Clostridia bacterium]